MQIVPQIVAENLAFLSSRSRSFSRITTIGTRRIAPSRLSSNTRSRWTRFCGPIPRSSAVLTHCVRCGIRFLTHPRNAGRQDLRCPFGCREQHRKQRSNQRSTAYYQTPSGKRKKKLLNAKRQRGASADHQKAKQQPTSTSTSEQQPANESLVPLELFLSEMALDESSVVSSPMLPYVRMVTSLIEGVPVSDQEMLSILRRAMRQQRIAYRTRTDYVLHMLHQHPP